MSGVPIFHSWHGFMCTNIVRQQRTFQISKADMSDLAYLAYCYEAMARYLNSVGHDPYIAGLPIAPNEDLASRYVGGNDSVAFVAKDHDKPLGCIMGRMAKSSFPPADLKNVGSIDVCYVESEYRESGLATKLTELIETWFREKGISTVELSYLAKNQSAATAWEHLGYEPFRVFAYKQL